MLPDWGRVGSGILLYIADGILSSTVDLTHSVYSVIVLDFTGVYT